MSPSDFQLASSLLCLWPQTSCGFSSLVPPELADCWRRCWLRASPSIPTPAHPLRAHEVLSLWWALKGEGRTCQTDQTKIRYVFYISTLPDHGTWPSKKSTVFINSQICTQASLGLQADSPPCLNSLKGSGFECTKLNLSVCLVSVFFSLFLSIHTDAHITFEHLKLLWTWSLDGSWNK